MDLFRDSAITTRPSLIAFILSSCTFTVILYFVFARQESVIQVDPAQLIFVARSLEGSLTGTAIDIEDTWRSASPQRSSDDQTVPLERAPEVYARMMRGEARFRIVPAGDPGCRCRGHRNEQAALWLSNWSNRSIRGRALASGSSSPTAGRHAG